MKKSAGLLVYKVENGTLKVLLGHMGGPFYAKKDAGAWDIPKGEFDEEEALQAARREFEEEVGQPAPDGEAFDLGEAKTSGKIVMIWAAEGGLDISKIRSNTFTIEWPPKSGQTQEFPELDRAAWLDLPTAMQKIIKSRTVFLERLAACLKNRLPKQDLTVLDAPTQNPEQASFF